MPGAVSTADAGTVVGTAAGRPAVVDSRGSGERSDLERDTTDA
jgi:hypothetical protein